MIIEIRYMYARRPAIATQINSFDFLYTDFTLSLQILSIFLENKVFQKSIETTYFLNESCSPILIFLGENQFWKDQRIKMNFWP